MLSIKPNEIRQLSALEGADGKAVFFIKAVLQRSYPTQHESLLEFHAADLVSNGLTADGETFTLKESNGGSRRSLARCE